MKRVLAVVACVATAAFFHPARVAAGPPAPGHEEAQGARLIDVPYVPQSPALCGGAALAMLLRYWGEPAVLAEDFAALREVGAPGIRTEALVAAARERGWTARPLAGTPALVRAELARGRPMIALIDVGSSTFHYVVVVAWVNGGVIAHDPAVGPFRVWDENAFDAAWARAGRWALLILPPAPEATESGAAPELPRAALAGAAGIPADSTRGRPADDCDAVVSRGLAQAGAGDTAGAAAQFRAAARLCPGSAAPWRELAGLRFGADDWDGAARLAERALALEPLDAHSWRLLAGSRYLAGDVEGALGAWNRIGEPRADLTRVEGLVRTRYRAVADPLDLAPRRLITPAAFIRARRRLAELPALADSRLSVTPAAGGVARIDVALLERPLLFAGPWDVGGAAIGAVVNRATAINVAGPVGLGELWTAEYGWWTERPRLRLALAVPGVGGRPGLWTVEGLWERQAYAASLSSATGGAPRPGIRRERRHRTSLSFADWAGAGLRVEAGAALDRWSDRGAFGSLRLGVEARAARDRLALLAELAGWAGARGGPFRALGLSARWHSHEFPRAAWQWRAGLLSVSARSPLALWPGAGTGSGRAPLLRAHPLLADGVLDGPAFGRTLLYGGIERQSWPWSIGPLRAGWALFLDAAQAHGTPGGGYEPWQTDAGVGLRLGGPGRRGLFRMDVAHGLTDGATALSVAWQTP